MKATFLVLALSTLSTLAQAQTLCGKNDKAPATPVDVCVVHDAYGTSAVELDGLKLPVTDEDGVHSDGRISELTFDDGHGNSGTSVVNWEEGWVEGYLNGKFFSVSHLEERK